MTNDERMEALKNIELFCKITEDMIPEGWEWQYVLRASLNGDEIPEQLPSIIKSRIKDATNNIYLIAGRDDNSAVQIGVARSGLHKDFENKEDFIQSSNASAYDGIIIALYNKYKAKAIKILKDRLNKLENLKDLEAE